MVKKKHSWWLATKIPEIIKSINATDGKKFDQQGNICAYYELIIWSTHQHILQKCAQFPRWLTVIHE